MSKGDKKKVEKNVTGTTNFINERKARKIHGVINDATEEIEAEKLLY